MTCSPQLIFSSVQFNSIEFSSVQFRSLQFNSIQLWTILLLSHITIYFILVQFNSIQFSLPVLCRRKHAEALITHSYSPRITYHVHIRLTHISKHTIGCFWFHPKHIKMEKLCADTE